MSHRGSEFSGKHPLLLGDGKLVRTMKFEDAKDLRAKRVALKKIVQSWCDGRPGEPT